jgi:hypothetical protein
MDKKHSRTDAYSNNATSFVLTTSYRSRNIVVYWLRLLRDRAGDSQSAQSGLREIGAEVSRTLWKHARFYI